MSNFNLKSYYIGCLIATLCLLGCQTKFILPENPPLLPALNKPVSRPRVALVLGGGGARGMCHVGVLEVFENLGIPIDVIVGCSAGAIVGALYADCPHARTIRFLLAPLKKWDILDINIWYARYGLVRGHSLRRFLHRNLRSRCFHDLQIPLYVVATDLMAGERVVLSSGPIIPAVHASAAVPFVFSPVVMHGRLLVDGGVADPIPVAVAKQLKAEIIIAVDLSELLPKTCPTNLFGIARRSAELKWLLQNKSCVQGADVVIVPELREIGMFDDKNNVAVYEAGRRAAQQAIPKILSLLAKKN
jgi:NTE family protein